MKLLAALLLVVCVSARAPITKYDNGLDGWAAQYDCKSPSANRAANERASRGEVRTWKIGEDFCAFGGNMSDSDVKDLAEIDGIMYIQNNIEVKLMGEQENPPSWGIDRVDQANLPLDQLYRWRDNANGFGVNVYVIDTGIYLEHPDWYSNQAHFGIDCSDILGNCNGGRLGDPHGHGTHCAGTVASPTYGVAKSAQVWDVKVLSALGTGSLFGIMSGIDFVDDHVTDNRKVISMSLGAARNVLLNAAINSAHNAGITCVAAAGNENQPTSNVSPASAENAIAVGATDMNDVRASFSNYGEDTQLFAPGVNIVSLGHTPENPIAVFSGTSMACPHVAGAVANIASRGFDDPNTIRDILLSETTSGVIQDAGPGSPNLLIYTSPQ